MSKLLLSVTLCMYSYFNLGAQIDPLTSPYYGNGSYTVEADSNLIDLSIPLLFYRPQTTGSYPVFMFQLGANGFGSSAINRHSYDLFMNHLASYGFVVIVIDDTQAGLPSGMSFMEAHDWYTAKVIDSQHWLFNYADASKFVVGGHSNGGVNACALLVDRPAEVDGIVFMDAYPSDGIFGIGAHDVSGYTGKEMTLSANENDPVPNKDGYNEFTSVECKTYVDITGLDHGGFGDYDLASQPVGPIGRDSATATIRHFLVSWMLSEFKGDIVASDHLTTTTLHPSTVGEFINNCGTLSSNGIEQTEMAYIEIYPNPTQNWIHISTQMEEVTVEVFDLLGHSIYSTSTHENQLEISLENVPKGIYIVHLSNSNSDFKMQEIVVKN